MVIPQSHGLGSTRAALAAGIVTDLIPPGVRRDSDYVTGVLVESLTASAVWQSGHIPQELRGEKAYGAPLPRWRSGALKAAQVDTFDAAWQNALPQRGKGMGDYLRLRVNSPEDARLLRDSGEIDGMTIVPSLDSRGDLRQFEWRWPLRVGVVPAPSADDWLMDVRNSTHLDMVFDAELWSPANEYDIVIVDAHVLSTLSSEWTSLLSEVACVIVAGDTGVEQVLRELDSRIKPSIAVAFRGTPAAWWRPFFHELCHDLPVDVAVELVARQGIDGMMAGPEWGLDITASAHWFASVAPELPALEPVLLDDSPWRWSSEGENTTEAVQRVRQAEYTGAELRVLIPERVGRLISGPGPHYLDEHLPARQPAQGRRLVARVYDGESVVQTVLPPNRDLQLAVCIAIPEKGDIAADEVMPMPSEAPGPTVPLKVSVCSDVWAVQPQPQMISVRKDRKSEPSSWAVFPLTTPDAGKLVSVEIVVLYQDKPLQAAIYESPIRAFGLPGERPTLRTFELSGPDEPTDDLKQVDVTLNGRGAELRRLDGQEGGIVLITDVQRMLDKIEERVSKVLGVPGAPDSFEDSKAFTLLVDLARLGSELARLLEPLNLDDAKSINVSVGVDTPVLPLELAYAAPPPDRNRAKLCQHVTKSDPPSLGQACDRADTRTVCPYAFWGLHRSIARTVWSGPPRRRSRSAVPFVPAPGFSILYAATVVADDGAVDPKPSDSVLAAARNAFSLVTRVTSWTAWRKAVRIGRPNLLVVLGHTTVGMETRLYIGRNSAVSRVDISAALLRSADSPKPLVLLIACSTASIGDPFGTLPGALTAAGAGAVVGTLSKIVGPQGAAATMHLLTSLHDAVGEESVGDAVARARYSLVNEKCPIGLLLVSHGELDTKAGY
ncbi:CHAT domain-containing protein [Lysobacter korlensis]|uniref:CHAT domain-containing protein n=1 Tax=Lysobacter korlensis TaxID=553636 RepID=A0ABV6S0N3_9GAMM